MKEERNYKCIYCDQQAEEGEYQCYDCDREDVLRMKEVEITVGRGKRRIRVLK